VSEKFKNTKYFESCAQEYTNCKFSAGLTDDPIDKIYLRLERPENSEDLTLLFRPDEAAAVAWMLSGALFSHEIHALIAEEEVKREAK
jgi:hypothetical protein